MTQSSVPVPLKVRRPTRSPVPAAPAWGPAAVAAVPAKIAMAQGQERARQPGDEAAVAGRGLVALAAGAPGQGEGGHKHEHAQAEVGHDVARGELVGDGDAAEHGLGDDAQRQQGAQPDQIAAARLAQERPREGGHGDEADDAADEAVAVLDHRVGLQRRHDGAEALGPVRAAQATAGQTHARAREHDDAERDQGDRREAGVGAGSQRQAAAHPGVQDARARAVALPPRLARRASFRVYTARR